PRPRAARTPHAPPRCRPGPGSASAAPWRAQPTQSRERRPPALGGLDLHDLELELRAAGRRDLHGLALLAAHDRLADRRLVRELPIGRVGLGRADDEVLDGLLR